MTCERSRISGLTAAMPSTSRWMATASSTVSELAVPQPPRTPRPPKDEIERRVAETLELVQLPGYQRRRTWEMSGGQQQRVAVARAVVGDQPLILADEPTGNLDSVHGQEVMDLLRSLNKEGTTIVMVTHSPAHADYAHRTVNLFDGHIITDNTRAA